MSRAQNMPVNVNINSIVLHFKCSCFDVWLIQPGILHGLWLIKQGIFHLEHASFSCDNFLRVLSKSQNWPAGAWSDQTFWQ